MYVPRHFSMTTEQAVELLTAAETAELVTAHPDGPAATLLPVLHRPDGDGLGSLLFHVTRTNDVWQRPHLGDALAICSGPDAYVAPPWLASYADNPGVPTWNYVTVHAYGDLIVHDDADWTARVVREVSARHGFDTALVDADGFARMLRAIVGLELRLTRVVGKAKLSQNKAPADVEGIAAGLRATGDADAARVAEAMDEVALPHAVERYRLLGELREGRPGFPGQDKSR
ncbi:FMN-binding negative transcriptional regulator [Nigerium massiliense]|uniref:FMN-binding negative transcriptional regulator n=1 Tax=Nigerium massiliense TaxID=1522317 RepID=UPI0006931F2E|nr:FMN-binding negative transcriptional regulator [Nigerium massiliense]